MSARPPRPTRRTVLRAGLAAAGLAAATPFVSCGARRRIGGGIADTSDARGHLVRDPVPGGAPASREDAAVLVVGGGVAGLSAAWRLARAGLDDLLVLELEDAPGGTAAWGESEVTRYPWGAHYVPRPTRDQRALCTLLAEAGVVRGFDDQGRAVAAEEHLCRAPQERLFLAGEWREGLFPLEGATDADLRQRERFEADAAALGARRDAGGRRAFAIPTSASARDDDLLALDRVSMAAWMAAQGYDAPRLRWSVEYACRDDYGAPPDRVSAWAGLHYFASRIAAPGDEPAPFLTWPEGNGFLVKHLAAAVPAGRLRTGAVVRSVEPAAGGGVRALWTDAATGALHEATARRAVVALPRHVARRVVRGLEGEKGGFETSPWVVANVALEAPPSSPGFPQAWDNVPYGSTSLGYVVATHQTDKASPATVWTWYRPLDGGAPASERERLLATPWEAWRDEVLADLGPSHRGLEERVVSVDVRRWGHGMVRPGPGFLWGEARRRAALPLGPVHFAAADLGGLPLFEEAQWAGVRAAEEALAALGKPVAESWT